MASSRWIDAELAPDVFAAVMATGIVSIAARDHAYPRIDRPLTALAVATFVVLLAVSTVRTLARRGSPVGHLRDPDVTLRLFTFVAACAVLGARFAAHPDVVWAAGIVAVTAWLVIGALCARAARTRRPDEWHTGAHGAWLLASVATAGLAITAADLGLRSTASSWTVVCALAWVLAIVLYLAITGLIVRRAVTAPLTTELVGPDSWILMGALAIATLAGDRLHAAAGASASMRWLADASRPMIAVLWVLASLWIPCLLYATVWRADRRPGSLRFAGVWWSAVFPLGMYSSATYATALQLDLRSLRTISLVFFWIALTVWVFVAIGWLRSVLRALRARRGAQTGRTGSGSTPPARRLRRSNTRRVPST